MEDTGLGRSREVRIQNDQIVMLLCKLLLDAVQLRRLFFFLCRFFCGLLRRFRLPDRLAGLGRLLLTSIEGRDEPVARAIVVLLAFAVILCNLAADLLARRIDPRLGSGAGGAA